MPIERKPVVVVGSINIDLVALAEKIPLEGQTVAGRDFQMQPGGKGANQAVAVARLGYPVRLIGRLGTDAFGSQLRGHLEHAGVELAGVKHVDGSSGIAMIVVAPGGENSIVVVPGANASVTPQDVEAEIEVIRSAGIVLTQLEIPIETVLHLAALCARENVPLILDPAPAKDLPEEIFAKIAWFTPNETEAAFYLQNAPMAANESKLAQLLLSRKVKGVVLKLGSRGAYLASADGCWAVSAFAMHAVDTTAAGDTFNGAFAVGLMTEMGMLESARFASAAAAISVTRPGAQPSMPTMAEVQELLSPAKSR